MAVADWIDPPHGGHGGPGNVLLFPFGAAVGFVIGVVVAGIAHGIVEARIQERERASRSQDASDVQRERPD